MCDSRHGSASLSRPTIIADWNKPRHMVVSVGPLRRVRLDPKFGSLYPEIPAGHWMPAWQAATRRAERLWRDAGADALLHGRILPDEHFQFRGGRPRGPNWYIEPERLSDPTRAEFSLGR